MADHIDALIGLTGSILVVILGSGIAAWRAAAKASRRRDLEMARLQEHVASIRNATTVNHHASASPTLVDRLDTVQQSIAGLTATVAAHHDEQERRNNQQDDRLAHGMARFAQITERIDRYHGKD